MFKVGIGPSSSHTMGPMVAAARFLDRVRRAPFHPKGLRASLHGSLAFTGVGHATDRAVILGLAGFVPESYDAERAEAFAAVDNIPSISNKADFCYKWIGSINKLEATHTHEERKGFLLNLICFAGCIEGLFFFAAFAYVYFMRSKGLLNGLAAGTNWVFRDESAHMSFAFEVINTVRDEQPELFDEDLEARVIEMFEEAVECEVKFAEDLLEGGVSGLSLKDMRAYLEFVADQRLANLGMAPRFGSKNPFAFMELQDVQELSNFFERKVSAYQVSVTGEVAFDEAF